MPKEKYKVIQDKKTGEVKIDYFYIRDKQVFRYKLFQSVFSSKERIIFSLDTNLLADGVDSVGYVQQLEAYFTKLEIEYRVIPTRSHKQKKVMGISVGTVNKPEFIFLFTANSSFVTEEVFKELFAGIDYLAGTDLKKPFLEICEDLQKGYYESLFDESLVGEAIFDSLKLNWIRMTKGLKAEL